VDEQRARIFDDLRDLIEGDLHFDPIARAAYRRDASLFDVDPLGVVAPRSRWDLAAVVRYAADQGIPLHARGSGTATVGSTLGKGLVIDFGRFLRRVVALDEDQVTVEPGVLLGDLNAQLAPFGRRVGPEPPQSWGHTVGGWIAADLSGARELSFAGASERLQAVTVVFGNGEIGRLAETAIPEDPPIGAAEPFEAMTLRRVTTLLNWHRSATIAPGHEPSRRLRRILDLKTGDRLNAAPLMVGSLGGFAHLTEVTLRTSPVPQAQRVLIVAFPSLAAASEAVPTCLLESPASCALADWRSLHFARGGDPFWAGAVPPQAGAALIVEFLADEPEVLAKRIRALVTRLAFGGPRPERIVEISRRDDALKALDLARFVEPRLRRLGGRELPVDLVALEARQTHWGELIRDLQRIFKDFGVDWTLQAHAGRGGWGRIRARPYLDVSDPEARGRLGALAEAMVQAALSGGGGPEGSSGRGLVSQALLERIDPQGERMFRALKELFDPWGRLNPEVFEPVTGNGSSRPVRSGAPAAGLEVIEPQLLWRGRTVSDQANACDACGGCRTLDPLLRICPSFRASRSEVDSPRAKVRMIQALANGELDRSVWGSEAARLAADSCVHCRLCRSECPSQIDISSLMLEVKAAHAEQHGLRPFEWFISRVETWSRWAGRFSGLYNVMIGSPRARRFFERISGISRYRGLPKVQSRPFLKRAEWMGLTEPRPDLPGPRVALFLDLVPNLYDHAVCEAAIALLRHCGVHVYIPKRQRSCGMPALVVGDVDRARETALANLRILGSAVREGYTIVCLEPTAALMIREEYPSLTEDLDAPFVAEHTMDLGQYILGLKARGLLPRPKARHHLRVGYHQPCHLRALEIGNPGLELLRSLPELEVEFIDRGCSGMAGIHGLSRERFRSSLRAGRDLRARIREPDLTIGASECSACRMQMEHGCSKRSYHPITLLAGGYGLVPIVGQDARRARSSRVVF